VDLVHKILKDPTLLSEGGRQNKLVWKLKVLKTHTKLWYKESIARNKEKLRSLESGIKDLIMRLVDDSSNLEEEKLLRHLELERNNILRGLEEQWRICSRATWLVSRDNNTKVFHNYASHNRIRKHVWEITDGNGIKLSEQGSLKEEAVLYFKKFYKSLVTTNTAEQVKIIEFFPGC